MHPLKNDTSIKGPVHCHRRLFDDCDMYTQVGDDSMAPAYLSGTYLFCDETGVDALEPGKAYVFCMRTHPHYNHVIKRFDGIVAGAIQISAINEAYHPCEPIPLVDLIEVYAPKWTFVKEEQESN